MRLNSSASCELIGQENIRNYITGGKGVVTLKSYTGIHHTYSFEAPSQNKSDDNLLFVKTLVNNDTWVYVGMYKNGKFQLTKASKYTKDSPIVKGVYYIMKLMYKPGFSDDRMHLFHEGICSVCGRPLTNPESIQIGVGPVCRESI